MEVKRILITGGSGFVGQTIARKFVEEGQDVCIYDVNKPDPSYGRYLRGDVFDTESLESAVKDCDVIIHLVGLADVGVSQREPAKSFRLNIASLQNVLEIARLHGSKKIVIPSSAAVYGIPETLPIKENFPLNMTNMYSWHKHMCEQLVKAHYMNYGLEYVILRLFNVYGKGNKGVINLFLTKAAQGEVIESFGPFQYRDFVYAGDVAIAFYKSAVYEKANNKIINIGSGKGTQIKEILELIQEIIPGARWAYKKQRFITYDSIADITLARILLDYKPQDSKEIMKKIIEEEMLNDVKSFLSKRL